MKSAVKTLIWLLVLAGLSWGGYAWYNRGGNGSAVSYRTAPVKRGELLATISATGTLEPEEVVDVGAQVAGQINTFGKDKAGKTIDYGSAVEEGMTLANIDDTLYAADAAQAAAQLRQAEAGVERAEADLEQMKAKLVQAGRDWDRAQKLGSSDALAEATYDGYKAAYDTAVAIVAVGEATIAQTKGTVLGAQASVKRASRNLSYCTIKSPVKGVIIDRRVNIGQTVVASLNAPSLFLIAKDLKHMQVWASVNEADIGSIREGQPAAFTVDAYPGRVFPGTVGKIRLNATMTQNVVTYTIEINTENSDGKLLPYLTANVQFEVARRPDVLLAPNVALRWTPSSAEQVVPESRDFYNSGGRGGPTTLAAPATQAAGRGPGTQPQGSGQRGGRDGRGEGGEYKRGVVWVQDGGLVKPIRVRVGLSDGTNTEIITDQIKEGAQVVTGAVRADQGGAEEARNPFMPQLGGRRGSSGGGGSGGSGKGG